MSLCVAAHAWGAPLDEAVALYRAKNYPAAREALEKIVAADPRNAAACYYLGMTLARRGDDKALDDAVPWLEKAVTLEPANARYLADYGGTSLELADKNRSLSAAIKGRDAMEKSLRLAPDDLDAREGLFQFYERAPWPLGSRAKAAAQLEEIRKRDPDRATVLEVVTQVAARDYAAAFRLCDEALAKNPSNYVALYQYGRTASISGQNLDRGLTALKKALAREPPGPAAPTHAHVWYRIGIIQEKLGRLSEARDAYANSARLDSSYRPAANALARLKPAAP